MMGFEESTEPPKKKLKQAQLPFCNQLVKSNKRKCTDSADDNKQAFKMMCKDVEVDTNALNKENMFVNNADSQSNDSCMEICEVTASNSIIIKESNSDPKENSKFLTGVAQSVDESVEISSSSVSTNERLVNHDNKNQLEVELKNDVMQIADTDDRSDKSIIDGNKADVENSDDEYAMETDANIKCNDTSNKSQSFSISSDDEKSDTTHSKQVTPPSSSEKKLKRKLTPKSLEKRKQRASLKLEKLQQKEKEKEAKLKIKMEKEEQKRREKEEKEEQKRKDKEEKEKKKLAELKQKEDERRLKEEEKKRKEEAKEEEKRLKEEERRRKEEAKEEERKKKEEAKLIEQRKEEQAKKAFTNFFILKKSKADSPESIETNVLPKFMPFPLKPDMRLAVEHRRSITIEDKTKLEASFNDTVEDNKLYLTELKNGQHTPHKTEPTWPVSDEQHDVIIIESVVDDDDSTDKQQQTNKSRSNLKKAKLLQFHENRRPAYWGTWRKKSDKVTPRRPFDKDDCLNYEVDSDSEWEDEGEGEDIDHEDDSDKEPSDEENCDEKNENGYILDNTFVPHGYLSDEEIEENEENFDPEDHKLRLKVLKEEFEEEMKTKAERLKPRLLGCVWISNDTTAVSKGSLYEILMNYRAVWNEDNGPIEVSGPTVEESPTVATNKSKQLPPLVVEQLAKFVHGNHLPFIAMVQEFRSLMDKENHPLISKRALSIKIKEIARKEFDENGKHLWYVNMDLCNEYGLTPLSQMNSSCNIEKSKDTFLDNFLKRPSVSPLQPAKASTPIQSAKSGSSTLSASVLQPPSTPMQSVVKKRATLITLPQTPVEVNKTSNKVHKDTPRPLHPFFKNIHFKEPAHNIQRKSTNDDDDDDDVVDLCND